ncbi:hypothetical protein ZWY2020_035552 [Hordeum vulgare]|nr:hypothetical protein ZWY2020_035552 [Hordeum vulgare]
MAMTGNNGQCGMENKPLTAVSETGVSCGLNVVATASTSFLWLSVYMNCLGPVPSVYSIAPALRRTMGSSSVAVLRPSPSRGLPRAALAPQGRRPVDARGVRWEAGRGGLVGERCTFAVSEKTVRKEEATGGGV